jgi:hypothetical protein
MRIAHRRVRQQHLLLLQHPLREFVGTELVQLLFAAWRRRRQIDLRQLRHHQPCGPRTRFHFRIAVHDHVADEIQQTRSAIALAREAEQFGRLIDELGRVLRRRELRMHDQLIEKAQIRHDAAHTKFPQRAMHAGDGFAGRR